MSLSHGLYRYEIDKDARKNSMKWILHHLMINKVVFFGLIVSLLLMIIFRAVLPVLIGMFIDSVLLPKNIEFLPLFISLIIIAGLIQIFSSFCVGFLANSLSWNAIRSIRYEFFDKIQSKPLKFHDNTRSGNMMAIATNDVNALSSMINPGIRMLSDAILSFIVFFIISIFSNIFLAILISPLLLLYFFTIIGHNNKIKPIAAVFQNRWAKMSISAQDNITGVRVVRAFGGEEFEIQKFSEVINDFKKTWVAEQTIQAKFYPLLVIYLAVGLGFFGGIWLVLENQLSIGMLLAFNGLLLILVPPTFIISFAITMFQGGLAGGERIFKLLSESHSEVSPLETKKPWPENLKGEIEFKNISFKYEGTNRLILNEINFKANPGEVIAIVGPTGSGKTTLSQLLLNLYDFEGQILIDGIDIREFSLNDLRQHIGRVEQDVFLFATSIESNIKFGLENENQISDEQLINVTKQAQAHEFIMEQSNGYKTIVGERGAGLSGGQKQRIAIARCLLTNPRILILDDSTSSIDSITEEKISIAMNNVVKNRTVFLITHRLSAIKSADKIILLKEGKIQAIGKHDELLRKSIDYQRIFIKKQNDEFNQIIKGSESFPMGGND